MESIEVKTAIPEYIQMLFAPRAKSQPQGRRIWSIDLETVLVPALTATNTVGKTSIPHEALGAPLRLGYDKAGAVRFGQSGKPVIRVAKEISDAVRGMRENLVANLLDFTGKVQTEEAEAYKAQVEANIKAGKPISNYDMSQLQLALKAQVEAEASAKAEAEAKMQAEAIAKAKLEAEASQPASQPEASQEESQPEASQPEAKAKHGKRELVHA